MLEISSRLKPGYDWVLAVVAGGCGVAFLLEFEKENGNLRFVRRRYVITPNAHISSFVL